MTKNSEIEKVVNGQLRPIDDVMFIKMAEDKDFLEELLQVILDDSGLTVLEHETQKELSNLGGRSARVDTLCRLGDQRLVNIEVQKSNDEDHQRRVRYHASLITANYTKPNTNFRDIPDVCVVYIAEFDIFNAGKALYEVKRMVSQTGNIVDNGLTELYVNAKSKDGSRIARLMEILATTDVYNQEFPKTSSRKHQLLNDTEEKQKMNTAIQALINKTTAEMQVKIAALSEENTALFDKNTALSGKIDEQAGKIDEQAGKIDELAYKIAELINENKKLRLELADIKKKSN